MKNTMSFVLKLVGLVLALTGLICLVVYYWENIINCVSGLKKKGNCECDCCFDDFDDDQIYDFTGCA